MNFEFSQKVANLSGTATREIFKLLANPNIVSFAGGLPASECLPLDEIRDIAIKILNSENGRKILQYGTTEGLPEMLEAVCDYSKMVGVKNARSENALIVGGGQQGIDLALKSFTNKGDTVLVENPTYLAILQMLKSNEAKIEGVTATDDGLDIVDLENKIKRHKPKVLYVVPTFSNPTGKTYSLQNRKQIAELTAKYGVIVIEDDPYSALRFSGAPIPSIKSIDTIGNIVYISSFSKTLAPGLRVGYAIAEPQVIRKMVVVKQGQDLHTSNLSQAIVLDFIKSGLLYNNIRKNALIYKAKKDFMVDCLKKYMPKSFKFNDPDGGLFVWCKLDKKMDAVKLFPKAIKKNVAYIQGSVFYASNPELNTLRLNYSTESKQRIEQGIKTLSTLL